MCRILGIKSKEILNVNDNLVKFAQMCRESKEYQGDGWGCAWLENEDWKEHHSITPIWADKLPKIPETTRFLVHARSAFQNKDIILENTMPFSNSEKKRVFIFNGEIRGVRINVDGRIGAEKIFTYIQLLSKNSIEEGIRKAVPIIEKKSSYIRAMNMLIAEGEDIYYVSHYNEQPEYFNLYRNDTEKYSMICSAPIDQNEWTLLNNKTIEKM